jgi:hypothetical protein
MTMFCKLSSSTSATGGKYTVDKMKQEIFNLTKIDRWFLVQIKEIVDFEEELAGAKISE